VEQAKFDFGAAVSVDAEAVGRPGQRRFRLMVRSTGQTASIWMEKQQLAGIGVWFDEMCARLDREHPTSEPDAEPSPFAGDYDVDFRSSQVGLNYDEHADRFAIQAFDLDASAGEAPAFRCELTRGQCRVLSRKIAALVAAGRPICPLCEQPMDPDGHVCPRSNGHHAPVTVA